MLGIYFSGTGNSRYALEVFLNQYDKTADICALTDQRIVNCIHENKDIVFSYSVQFSSIPKMLKDFVDDNKDLWSGKNIFVIATMGLFSGDGAGILARRLRQYGAQIQGGLHLKMPDSIADEKALKRSLDKNKMFGKIALVGYNDSDYLNYALRRIYSISQPASALGQTAGRHILAQIEHQAPPQHEELCATFSEPKLWL